MWSALGKYRSIVVSIALFLLLDASVLTLNFYISYKIADDAVGINLAGRQRMLSQRTVKSIYNVQSAVAEGDDPAKALKELSLSHGLFQSTLLAFDRGGATTGADGRTVQLKATQSEAGRRAIEQAKVVWAPYSEAIQNVLKSQSQRQLNETLPFAIHFARENNLQLLTLMNKLTVDLEQVATSQATTLRLIQSAGISLAIINFLLILFHFIGELKRNDRALELARKETTDILKTVNEGLFLLDAELKIGTQHSARLEEIFGGKAVAGQTIEDMLKDLVKPKDLETAQRFIALLFRADVKSNLITDLNPLNQIEIHISDSSGGYESRYLSFDFTRVLDNKQIKNILVTVNDITAQVKLARELEQEKERNEQQLEMLTSILHTKPNTLKRFIQNSLDVFGRINSVLKDPAKTESALRRKLDSMFIEVHNFKGESAALKLDSFAELAHHFESDIQALKDANSVVGNDFLRLAVHLEKLMRYTESVQQLAAKLASFSGVSDTPAAPPREPEPQAQRWQLLEDLCKGICQRSGKQAELVLSGLSEIDLDEQTDKFIQDVCVQMIRNSVMHSIEKPQQRKAKGKLEQARIDIRLAKLASGQLELTVRDDGQGLDFNKIRQRALELNKWSPEDVKHFDNKQLTRLIFEPGFSTADQLSDDAGRGVGMDVIRDRVNRSRGKIKIASRPGENCQFTIHLPGSAAAA